MESYPKSENQLLYYDERSGASINHSKGRLLLKQDSSPNALELPSLKTDPVPDKQKNLTFSKTLSSKNLTLIGGGVIAVAPEAEETLTAVVSGVQQEGVQFVDVICPDNLMDIKFGMVTSKDDFSASEGKFISFRTSTKRRVTFKIDFDARETTFFFEKLKKNKIFRFDEGEAFPAMILNKPNGKLFLCQKSLFQAEFGLASCLNKEVKPDILDYLTVFEKVENEQKTVEHIKDLLKNAGISKHKVLYFSDSSAVLVNTFNSEAKAAFEEGMGAKLPKMAEKSLELVKYMLLDNLVSIEDQEVPFKFLSSKLSDKSDKTSHQLATFISENISILLSPTDLSLTETVKTALNAVETAKNTVETANLEESQEIYRVEDGFIITEGSALKKVMKEDEQFPVLSPSLNVPKEDLILLLKSLDFTKLERTLVNSQAKLNLLNFLESLERVSILGESVCLDISPKLAVSATETLLKYLSQCLYVKNNQDCLQAVPRKQAVSSNEIIQSFIDALKQASEQPIELEKSVFEQNTDISKCISVLLKLNAAAASKGNLTSTFASDFTRLSSFLNCNINPSLKASDYAELGLFVDNPYEGKMKRFDISSINTDDLSKAKTKEELHLEFTKMYPSLSKNTPDTLNFSTLTTHVNNQPASLHSSPISILSHCNDLPLSATASSDGKVSVWNTQYTLTKVGELDLKRNFKSISNLSEIKGVESILNNPDSTTLTDIFTSIKPTNKTKTKKREKNKDKIIPNEQSVNDLYVMGFELESCKKALIESNNNFDKALEKLLENKQESPKIVSEPKEFIEAWNCAKCTYKNQEKILNCEMCGSNVPEDVLDKAKKLDNQAKNEILQSAQVAEQTPELSEKPEEDSLLSKCKLVNVHLIYEPSDSAAPLLVVGTFFDLTNDSLIVTSSKMAIHPLFMKEFIIKYKSNSFVNSIDYHETASLEEALTHLQKHHQENLFTLSPLFAASLFSEPPLLFQECEKRRFDLPLTAYFDSTVSRIDNSLLVLSESEDSNFQIIKVKFTSNYKFFNLEIPSHTHKLSSEDVTNMVKSNLTTEIKLLTDTESINLVSHKIIWHLNSDFLLTGKHEVNCSGNSLVAFDSEMKDSKLTKITVIDDKNERKTVDLTPKAEEQEKVSLLGLDKAVEKIKEMDLELLENKVISCIQGSVLSSDIKFEGNCKTETKKMVENKATVALENKPSEMTIEFLYSGKDGVKPVPFSAKCREELDSAPALPLRMHDYHGSQSRKQFLVNSLHKNITFMSNYSEPWFVFKAANGESVSFDRIIVGSPKEDRMEVPMGEFLLFAFNGLDQIQNITSMRRLPHDKLVEMCKKGGVNAPVAAVKMGKEKYVDISFETQVNCRYLVLLPTNSRSLPKNTTTKYLKTNLSLSYFAAFGSLKEEAPLSNYKVTVGKQDSVEVLQFTRQALTNNYGETERYKGTVKLQLDESETCNSISITLPSELKGESATFSGKEVSIAPVEGLEGISVTHLAIVLKEPAYFSVINKRIVELICSCENEEKKLSLASFLGKNATTNSNLMELVRNNLDVKRLLKYSILECNSDSLINTVLTILPENIEDELECLLCELGETKFTPKGLKTLFKLYTEKTPLERQQKTLSNILFDCISRANKLIAKSELDQRLANLTGISSLTSEQAFFEFQKVCSEEQVEGIPHEIWTKVSKCRYTAIFNLKNRYLIDKIRLHFSQMRAEYVSFSLSIYKKNSENQFDRLRHMKFNEIHWHYLADLPESEKYKSDPFLLLDSIQEEGKYFKIEIVFDFEFSKLALTDFNFNVVADFEGRLIAKDSTDNLPEFKVPKDSKPEKKVICNRDYYKLKGKGQENLYSTIKSSEVEENKVTPIGHFEKELSLELNKPKPSHSQIQSLLDKLTKTQKSNRAATNSFNLKNSLSANVSISKFCLEKVADQGQSLLEGSEKQQVDTVLSVIEFINNHFSIKEKPKMFAKISEILPKTESFTSNLFLQIKEKYFSSEEKSSKLLKFTECLNVNTAVICDNIAKLFEKVLNQSQIKESLVQIYSLFHLVKLDSAQKFTSLLKLFNTVLSHITEKKLPACLNEVVVEIISTQMKAHCIDSKHSIPVETAVALFETVCKVDLLDFPEPLDQVDRMLGFRSTSQNSPLAENKRENFIKVLEFLVNQVKINLKENSMHKLEFYFEMLNRKYVEMETFGLSQEQITALKRHADDLLKIFVEKAENSTFTEWMDYISTLSNYSLNNSISFEATRKTIVETCHSKRTNKLVILKDLYSVFKQIMRKDKIDDQTYQVTLETALALAKGYFNGELESRIGLFVGDMLNVMLSANSENPLGKELWFSVNDALLKDICLFSCEFILRYLNLSSYMTTVSSLKSSFIHVEIAVNFVAVLDNSRDQLKSIVSQMNSEEQRSFARCLLVFNTFNKYSENNTPVIKRISWLGNKLDSIAFQLLEISEFNKVFMREIIELIREVDNYVYANLEKDVITQKKAIILCEKAYSAVEKYLEVCLTSDELTEFFAFEIKGFEFFIDRVNKHKNISYSEDSSKEEAVLKEELSKLSFLKSAKKEKEKEEAFDAANFPIAEFANTNKMTLHEPSFHESTNKVTNKRWSSKKSGANSHLMVLEFKGEDKTSTSLCFSLEEPVEIKDIQIGFSSAITGFNDKASGVVEEVFLEAGLTSNNLELKVQLERIDDIVYTDKSVTTFGTCFYKFAPSKENAGDLPKVFESILSCRAQYLKFTVRKPFQLCNSLTYLEKLKGETAVIGLNHVSVSGTSVVSSEQVVRHIQDKEKDMSIKIISKVFNSDNTRTLKRLSEDPSTEDNIKKIYLSFENHLDKHIQDLADILINSAMFNYQLGEWMIDPMLKRTNSEFHAKLALEICKTSKDYISPRIDKVLQFVLREMVSLAEEKNKDTQLIKRICSFGYLLSITLAGLLVSGELEKPVKLTVKKDQLYSIFKGIRTFNKELDKVIHLLCTLLIPSEMIELTESMTPPEVVEYLMELNKTTLLDDYYVILSILVANSIHFSTECRSNGFFEYFVEDFLDKIKRRIRGKNLLSGMKALRNMSYSKDFVYKINKNNLDFKIFDSLKTDSPDSDCILINNNKNFIADFITFFRNTSEGKQANYDRMASILVEDLQKLSDRNDKSYSNNLLMGLLRSENTVSVSLVPHDTRKNSAMSMHITLKNNTKIKPEKNKKKAEEKFIDSTLMDDSQIALVKSQIDKQFANDKVKPVKCIKLLSTTQNMEFSVVADKLSGKGPFLVLCSDKTSGNENTVGFFCKAQIPVVSDVASTADVMYKIPYTTQNFLFQMKKEQYIFQEILPEPDEMTGKEFEIANLSIDQGTYNFFVSSDLIYVAFDDFSNSTVNPFPELTKTLVQKGIQDVEFMNIKTFEIYEVELETEESNQGQAVSENKFRFCEANGNLNEFKVTTLPYFKKQHPLSFYRNNPVFEFPANTSIQSLKEFFYHKEVKLQLPKVKYEVDSEDTLKKIGEVYEEGTGAVYPHKIVDLLYDIHSLGKAPIARKDQTIKVYDIEMPIFDSFNKLNGIQMILSVIEKKVADWNNKEVKGLWMEWVSNVKAYSVLPSFLQSFIKHKKCFDIIFELLSGNSKGKLANDSVVKESSEIIFEILEKSFVQDDSQKSREDAIESGIFNSILKRLSLVSKEKNRVFKEEDEEKEVIKVQTKEPSKSNKIRGVGYGSDQTGDNKVWDITGYLEKKKNSSDMISSLVFVIAEFFNTNKLVLSKEFEHEILESCLLPCIEAALRGGSLLELAKEDKLYFSYLKLVENLSLNKSTSSLLLEISPKYAPRQTESIRSLLLKLNDRAIVFLKAMTESTGEPSIEQKLAKRIQETTETVQTNMALFQASSSSAISMQSILQMSPEKSYPALLRDLTFGYSDMKKNDKYIHFNANSMSKEKPTSKKLVRLAQEYADLTKALPCEVTNSIFVRVDENKMDLMKVLIMGSEGTPYAHGAFLFDVYFNTDYPNGPPKVNIMTTGSGQVRFNPNLYATGKVCLSLLGTWRGNATENWDPKISTLLQVLLSVQSIIMSELVYFNEPSCEGEIGKPEGEAKNEAYSNIVRYCNIKYAMIDQMKNPTPGFEDVIKRHFYLKKDRILKEAQEWIERGKTKTAKYSSYSYDHNSSWANKFKKKEDYVKELEAIYKELEDTLSSLEPPKEDHPRKEEVKVRAKKTRQNTKLEFVNLDNVDVSYEKGFEQKELNVDDESVKDRWSRYIGAMGIDAVKKQSNSSIFLSGVSPLGVEIAKNLVLSGCKRFTLHDNKLARLEDLSGQFFLTEQDIGRNRAEATLEKLRQLNYYVKINSLTGNLPTSEEEATKIGLQDYNVVILTETQPEELFAINNFCRKKGIKVINADLHGCFGRVMNDFGEKFEVLDVDGEELVEVMLSSITNEKEGIVTCLKDTRHNLSDGDSVTFKEVIGMNTSDGKDSINGKVMKVKVISPDKFSVEDTTIFSKYERNGMVKQLKKRIEISFKPLETFYKTENLQQDENLQFSDFTQMDDHVAVKLAMNAVTEFYGKHGHYPEAWNLKEATEIVENAKATAEKLKVKLEDTHLKLIHLVAFTSSVQLPPLAAFFGGVVAQEAVKSITNKFCPINQSFYYNSKDILPKLELDKLEESLTAISFKKGTERDEGMKVLLGKELLEKVRGTKLLMVGAGAIGCELLKNFAMMEVGTRKGSSTGGKIVVTDPDIIEVSNLNRQFLFREKHLRQPKSVTASAAAIAMNPRLKGQIFAKLDKVTEQSEHIFSDKFFKSLTIVANALDNVRARIYVDSRCVTNRVPLLESGTLGPKGHVQIIVPHKTESYGSQEDPEVTTEIAQCTLKMFPEEIIHCIEWARDRFGKIFTQRPKDLNRAFEEGPDAVEVKILKQITKFIKERPQTFEECVSIARCKFEKYFSNNIKQLLYSYPLDKKNSDGSLFWTLPKRPPTEIAYDYENILHQDFIAAYSCLMATVFKIKIPFQKPRSKESKLEIAAMAAKVVVPEFNVNKDKAKQIEKTVEKEKEKEKEEKEAEKEEKVIDVEELKKSFMLVKEEMKVPDLTKLSEKEKKHYEFAPEEFEKDNDANYHVDFIYSMANLRARNYKLEEMDWINVKLKAGKIVAALATTTACVSGLQALELLKLAKGLSVESIRNSFVNLAVPFVSSSEPGEIIKYELKEGLKVDLWDRWELKLKDLTIQSILTELKESYGLIPRDIFRGSKLVFSAGMDNKLKTSITDLIDLYEDDTYVDLAVTFSLTPEGELLKNVPPVRILLK